MERKRIAIGSLYLDSRNRNCQIHSGRSERWNVHGGRQGYGLGIISHQLESVIGGADNLCAVVGNGKRKVDIFARIYRCRSNDRRDFEVFVGRNEHAHLINDSILSISAQRQKCYTESFATISDSRCKRKFNLLPILGGALQRNQSIGNIRPVAVVTGHLYLYLIIAGSTVYVEFDDGAAACYIFYRCGGKACRAAACSVPRSVNGEAAVLVYRLGDDGTFRGARGHSLPID